MSIVALYELVLQQEYAGQTCINRWNYEMSGTPAGVSGSFALLSAFGLIPASVTNLLPTGSPGEGIQLLQSQEVSWQQAIAKNIYDVVDFFDNPYVVPIGGGIATTVTAPPFAAYGFRTSRVRSDIDRGTKRFVGIPQSYILSDGAFDSSATPLMIDLAERMGDTLSYTDSGNSLTFVPTVVSKEKYTTPSGRDAYRYYSTLVTQLTHVAQGFLWQPYDTVRSQVSRQFGKGD